jgi:predicted DNA-binding transcriptional regulator AlpA
METYRIRAETAPLADAAAWADGNEATVDALMENGVEDVVGWASFGKVGAMFHLEAGDVATAAAQGSRVFQRALRRADVRARIAYLEVGSGMDDDEEPALVGATDVARMIGVSRQRVYQLAATVAFPRAVAQLARGAMWRRADVEGWIAVRAAQTARRMEGSGALSSRPDRVRGASPAHRTT